jgi:hypothetical protein
VLLALLLIACNEAADHSGAEPETRALRTRQQAADSTRKVLILGSTVANGLQSQEARAVLAMPPNPTPFQVEVVTPAQWKAMTAEQFMNYRALVIGDAACTSGTAAWQAAIETRATWSAIVDGNIVVIGTNLATNSWSAEFGEIDPVVQEALESVVERPRRTGMYVSLGCAYMNAPATGTQVELLSPFGTFKVAGGVSCFQDPEIPQAHIPAQLPSTYMEFANGTMLTGVDGCAAKSVFLDYPKNDFSITALARNLDGTIPGAEVYHDFDFAEDISGTPFILTRGATSVGLGCGDGGSNIPSGEECDLGDQTNGLPYPLFNPSCSWSCKLEWCGDGVVQAHLGEACDNGAHNGRDLNGNIANGMCTEMCRIVAIPAPPSSPPVARCQNVTVAATDNTCGAMADINNGSSDPDGDLVGCTQNPAGPYGLGSTTVTLTCSDQTGKSSSCSGTVTVTDGVAPTIALNGPNAMVLQCGVETYTEQGAIANDVCPAGSITPTIAGTVNTRVPAPYTLTYTAKDTANNTASVNRTVTVSDTRKPTITLVGSANQAVECSATGSYLDPGASVTDACASIPASAIVKGGSVNLKTLGTYPLTYDVTDPSGNAADQKTRLVTVQDMTAPILTVAPYTNVRVECGDPNFAHPPVAITDLCFTTGPFTAPVPSKTVNTKLLGSQAVTYTATDPVGNLGASGPRFFQVSDTLRPQLTLLGASPMALECGDPFSDPGATANDQCAGNLTAQIAKTGTVDNKTSGAYNLVYSVTDGRTAAVTASRQVMVSDTQPPTVTLNGSATVPVECGSTYTEQGAVASDKCDGQLTPTALGQVQTQTPGDYPITWIATDRAGGQGSATRTVTVIDTQAPVIALNSPANTDLQCGTPYADPTTANDACAGDLTPQIVHTGSVNSQQPGSYPVGYTVTDPSGLSASASRTVRVIDTVAPVVTMTGGSTAELECGTGPFVDPGGSATDSCFTGPLTVVPTVVVDPNAPGAYTIQYTATDPSGNTGMAAGSRTVTVSDTQEPAVTLNGAAVQSLECGTAYNEPGATASDVCRGNLPVTITGGVNHMAPASYSVGYSATDGVFTKSASRTVNVSDTLAPELTILGSTNDAFECGSTYVDPGATASDACAGDVTSRITAEKVGNPNAPGSFTINYTVTDPAGNSRTATGARTVTVSDNTPPVLARNGAATVSLECGTAYSDLGATANDACDGDLTGSIVTTNPVATGTPGNYTVRYNVTDQAGLSAPEVTRTVAVSDTQPPMLTVNGPLSQTLECGAGVYQDPGATAVDACSPTTTVTPSTVVDQNAPGSYTITYAATDPSGNTGTSNVSRSVTVQDTLPPQLVLNGPANPGVECGTAYNDPGASANDLCNGTLPVTKAGSVDHTAPGNYPLSYTATDGQWTASATRTVAVSDTLAPSLTVLGATNDTFECGSTYVDPGATAADVCAGDVTSRITSQTVGNPNAPGTFTINYTVTDPTGNSTTVTGARTVTVNDNEPPVMALNGPATMGLECAVDTYTELGATANDACFGDVTGRIVIGGDTVNPAAPGSYTRTYNVTDQAGRSAPQLTRTVTVTDTMAPSITVLPPFAQAFECGTGPYTDPGAAASDACAGDLTGAIVTTGQVLPGAAGQYTLSYSVTDPSGNRTTAAQTRTVMVQDTLPPSIALNGAATVGLECGTAYNELGATANDACAGDLTGAISTTGTVDPGTVGSYTRTYSVTDPSGQSAQTSRQVNVSDTLAPTLALVGPASQLVECGGSYVDAGAQATDQCAGDLTAAIVRGGTVDPSVLGPYMVTYDVQDPSGHPAPRVSRSVTVQDTLVPVITVNGPLSQQHECGSTYTDPGATANDQCAGDLTAAIVPTQTGNPNAPGSFSISYSVTDPSGNSVTSAVTRTVMVSDNAAPVLALNGPATMNVECATAYNELGATANDACFGDLTPDIVKSGTVNVNQPAQYTVVYNVTDPAGQIAAPVSRTVIVNDTLAPSIALVGPTDATFECGTTYQDPGATASDTCAGDLTAMVVATPTPVPGQPGTTSISYSVTDPSGNTAVSAISRTVRMIDNEPPVVTLRGLPTERKECGTPYADPGATATDTCEGNLPVAVAGAVDHTTAGSYTLTYTATDLVGNTDTKTRNVTVTDTQGPRITLNGGSPMVVECNPSGMWADPGATATDLCSGQEDVIATGTVNPAVPDGYVIRYDAQDNSGNAAVPVIRNVLVQDNLAPVIRLNGPNPMVLECALGNLDNDPMAQVVDQCYGDTSHTVFRDFTNLNINQVGNYFARYQGDDTVGHVAQITRDLQVVDTTGPVLTALNDGETIECGTQPSRGVTAIDACYGPVPVIATPSSLPNSAGVYVVTYSAVDPKDNLSTNTVTRTIVVEDTTMPELSISDQDIYYECTGYAIGNVWNAPVVTATDTCEGALQVHAYNSGDDDEDGIPGSIDPDDFGPGPTTEVEGLYYVQYLAWDESYNLQGGFLSVYVQDTLKPMLGLNDDNDGGDPAYEQAECFLPRPGREDPNPYVDPGAWAEDQCYGDLSQEIVTFGHVEKQVPGIYTLMYQVRDGALNWADPVARTVEIIDSQQPTVTDRNTSLKPSDGTMRRVELSQCAEAEDLCEGVLDINAIGGVLNITSNEPGDDAGDIIFTEGTSIFHLRAESNPGGGGRVYSVEFAVSDSTGNTTVSQCLIRVPPPPQVASVANTSISTPAYSGTAEAGTTITVFVDGANVGTTLADAAGNWSFTQPVPLADGQRTVRVTATDADNKISPSATVSFTVQTTLAGR